MGLSRIRLEKYIELYSEKCNIPNLSSDSISGVNKDKEFFEPSKQVGSDTSKYKIVPPRYFACNLMHVGRDIVLPIAYNHSNKNKVISPAYQVFKFLNNEELLSEYFFLYLKSYERDRYFWFNTDSSVRDGMTWNDFVNIEIDLPPLAIQQKYVDVYNAMVANQKAYEHGLEDLKLVCDAYIEDLRRRIPCEAIGPYIDSVNENNSEEAYTHAKGVQSGGSFIDTRANMQGVDIGKYTVVRKGNIAYNPSRINIGSIALYNSDKPCVVSPMYSVFKVTDADKVSPEYLMLWFNRTEFQRYTWYYAAGSVRDTFDFNLMQEVEFPIPSIEIQKDIVNILTAYNKRKSINEKLKTQIKAICPILIKGSIEEGNNTQEA